MMLNGRLCCMSELREGVFTDVFQNISKQIPNGVPLMGKNTLDLELFLFIISITIIKKKLLTDIETNIIQNLNSTYPNELINIQQVSTYNTNYFLEIHHYNNSWMTRFNPK